jgi:sister chromatid cohesion protein PDS5
LKPTSAPIKIIFVFTAVDRVSQQLDRILPDYMILFAIPILSHVSGFERYNDVEMLMKLHNSLIFIMEPLITKNDNFSFGFYKALLEKMKMHKDKKNPDDEATNYVSDSVCALFEGMLMFPFMSRNCGSLSTFA